MTGKTTKESTKVDGNLRLVYEVVREDGKLTWVRLRIQDITTLNEVGSGYYNANLGGVHLNYSRMESFTPGQRSVIASEFISLVNSELEPETK